MSRFKIKSDWLRQLPPNRKGDMGECFVKTHLLSKAREKKTLFFPEFGENGSSVVKHQLRHNERYSFEDIEGEEDVNSIYWYSDFTITLYSGTKNKDMRRWIAVEVKTGEYADFERNQKRVMGLLNENEDYLVLRAKVHFNSEPVAEIRYSTLEPFEGANAGYRFTGYDMTRR